MSFFMPLENNKPFIKVAFEGFAGSGKTYTAVDLAINLHHAIGSKKPIVGYDTERALRALLPKFKANKIECQTRETRTLPDLSQAIKLCHEGYSDILIIDSITHVWENYLNAYMKQKNRSYLQFQDWGVIKPVWKDRFSDAFVNANCHIIFTGRAGYTYDTEEITDDQGRVRREINKSGIKMKAENETAFEPDLLVLMEVKQDVIGEKKEIWREATIIKDRSTLIDGKVFRNPTYADFEPFILQMLDGSIVEHETVGNEIDFKALEPKFSSDKQDREIILEKIKAAFDMMKLGTGKEEKAIKFKILKTYFGTTSWTEIERMDVRAVTFGYTMLDAYSQAFTTYVNNCAESGSIVDFTHLDEMIEFVKEEYDVSEIKL